MRNIYLGWQYKCQSFLPNIQRRGLRLATQFALVFLLRFGLIGTSDSPVATLLIR
jgi:hypothetical protein